MRRRRGSVWGGDLRLASDFVGEGVAHPGIVAWVGYCATGVELHAPSDSTECDQNQEGEYDYSKAGDHARNGIARVRNCTQFYLPAAPRGVAAAGA